ncbi:MAG: imidazole glycerol phosphate synthase subunit HisH [Betaproteobacteria bacterium]
MSRPSIALVDYGAGNLTSAKKALAAVGADFFVPAAPEALAGARGVVVPGVGHFGATRALGPAWIEALVAAIGEGRPLLGICLGMQWLFEGSDEAPELPGLGLLSGRCHRLRGGSPPGSLKVPHVGWNGLALTRDAPILDGVPPDAQVYFTHSYAAPVTRDAVAVAEHGERFAAAVQRGHVAGVQFHPEKSGDVGLRILRNFLLLT